MSDILIKGMEMPINCCHCPLIGYDPDIEWNDGGIETQGAYICVLTGELIDNTKREAHCPLIELPPHGRLIDADALREDWLENGENEYVYDTNAFLDSLDNAPTVIEAEEEQT